MLHVKQSKRRGEIEDTLFYGEHNRSSDRQLTQSWKTLRTNEAEIQRFCIWIICLNVLLEEEQREPEQA